MKRLISFLKPYLKLICISTVMILFSTMCDLLLPTIMSDILNNGIYNRDLSYIITCCLKMLAVSVIGIGTILIGVWISTHVVEGYCADLRRAVFQKVNAMTFEEFGGIGTGALVTRATHDVETMSWVASELSGTVVTIPVLFLGGVFLAMRKDVSLSLMLLAFVPIIVVIVLQIGKNIIPLWDKSDEYIDKQNDLMRQRIRGIRVIRAFNTESQEHARIAEATRVMAENIIKSNISMGLISPLATLLLNIATVLIVYVGGIRMENGSNLSGGDIFAIVQYIALVSNGVIMGAFSVIMIPHAKVAARRICQVLNTEGTQDNIRHDDISLSGNICFEHVDFRYEGAAEYALKDITFEIKAGEHIAIIGGTGSGKSTIVSMLLGFRAPTSGCLYFDGFSAQNISRHTMRKHISPVLQGTSIYSGTIAENVRMGDPNANDEQIEYALRLAQAADFVNELPDGLNHVIKQSGKNLSGGQKQRISIARALVKDAPIYIFDDSFSALDFLTEAKLRSALRKHLAGKTQLVITQRVSSAMHADRVIVMDQGRIVGCDTHENLLRNCDIYRQIYASQTGGGAE